MSVQSSTGDVWSRYGRSVTIGTVAVLLTISLAGCGAASSEEAAADPAETSQSVEETPTADVEPEVSLEEQIEALRIPTGLSDQELAETLFERTNAWWVAGANDSLLDGKFNANTSWDEYLPTVALSNKELFAPALFGDDWSSNPDTQTLISNLEKGNRTVLQNFTATAWNEDPENKAAYTSWSEVTSVIPVESTDTSRTLAITFANYDNSLKNVVIDNALLPSEVITLTFTSVDGSEIVTDVAF